MPLLQLCRLLELRLARQLGELPGQRVVGHLLGGRGRQLCRLNGWGAEVRCSRLGLERDTARYRLYIYLPFLSKTISCICPPNLGCGED